MTEPKEFQQQIHTWYYQNRRSFPWRETTDPYAIMVSELMLQQTQTHRVLPKYLAFIDKFPTVESLAKASLVQVLSRWQGLGYNRRAKFLHQAAAAVTQDFQGKFPSNADALIKLPGIGPYTSKAIATFAFNSPEVFIETNIRSVYLHHFFKDQNEVSDKAILELVEKTLDRDNPRDWYYALMDYGVYIKQTHGNPNTRSKHYTKQSKFEGSNRQIRGQILKHLLQARMTEAELSQRISKESPRIAHNLQKLTAEGLIVRDTSGHYQISESDKRT